MLTASAKKSPKNPVNSKKSPAPNKSPKNKKSPVPPKPPASSSPVLQKSVEPTESHSALKSAAPSKQKSSLKSDKQLTNSTKVSTKDQSKRPTKHDEKTSKDENGELLKIGEILRTRYIIKSKLGRGGCGQIYRAYDKIKSRLVAVKIATAKVDPRRMKIEQMVLTMLRGKNHFVTLIGMGQIRGAPYLVMDLVGSNLSDLRRMLPQRRLQPLTVYRISMQVISALHDMHNVGFLHRDVKPSNLSIGRGNYRRVIYLLDHGMARMFTEMDGTFRTPRTYAGFRGTLRYVSLTVHSRRETGPRDDLIGWFYSMIELINGKLPWSDLTSLKDVEQAKKNETLESLCKGQPKASLEFAEYITSLETFKTPNYDRMYGMFKAAVNSKYIVDTPFEWENLKLAQGKAEGTKNNNGQGEKVEKIGQSAELVVFDKTQGSK